MSRRHAGRISSTRHLDCGCALVLSETANDSIQLRRLDHEGGEVQCVTLFPDELEDLSLLVASLRRKRTWRDRRESKCV